MTTCFLMKDRNAIDIDIRGVGQKLGPIQGKTNRNILCEKKKPTFNKRKI